MNTAYLSLQIHASPDVGEILMAMMAEMGFEGFEEQDDGFTGFVPESALDREKVMALLASFPEATLMQEKAIPNVNWNHAWEAAYEPIYVDSFCQILASFHEEQPGFTHTLWVNPKMSFGTGHHATTRLMIRQMQPLPLQEKRVLDMGCGTGILAILARMLGAAETMGIDIDEWSYKNASENAALNEISDITWLRGDADAIPDQKVDLLLANINRNVLLADIPTYAQHLSPEGILILSGFVEVDLPLIQDKLRSESFVEGALLQEDEWLSILARPANF